MIVENSRKYLDAPSSADAKALQTKGRDRKNSQDQSTGKGSTDYACHWCGSIEHWIEDCPHKPARMSQQAGTQSYGSQNQSSNVSNGNQPVKAQPKSQPQKKGEKGIGKGKNKGKDEVKRSVPKSKAKSRSRPAARALDWEDDEIMMITSMMIRIKNQILQRMPRVTSSMTRTGTKRNRKSQNNLRMKNKRLKLFLLK